MHGCTVMKNIAQRANRRRPVISSDPYKPCQLRLASSRNRALCVGHVRHKRFSCSLSFKPNVPLHKSVSPAVVRNWTKESSAPTGAKQQPGREMLRGLAHSELTLTHSACHFQLICTFPDFVHADKILRCITSLLQLVELLSKTGEFVIDFLDDRHSGYLLNILEVMSFSITSQHKKALAPLVSYSNDSKKNMDSPKKYPPPKNVPGRKIPRPEKCRTGINVSHRLSPRTNRGEPQKRLPSFSLRR